MVITGFQDYAGDGGVHSIVDIIKAGMQPVAPPGQNKAKWIQVSVISGSGTGRIGDNTISTTRGIPFGQSFGGSFSPPIAELSNEYMLDNIYLMVPATMVVSIGLGR